MTTTNKPMVNPDKLATQDTGRRQTKQWTIQINWLGTQDTGRSQTKQWTIQITCQHKTQDEDKQNNGQSR
jgi:hypothetical protein